MKLGSLQYAILKTALSIFSIVLWTNGNFDLSDVSIAPTINYLSNHTTQNILHYKIYYTLKSNDFATKCYKRYAHQEFKIGAELTDLNEHEKKSTHRAPLLKNI